MYSIVSGIMLALVLSLAVMGWRLNAAVEANGVLKANSEVLTQAVGTAKKAMKARQIESRRVEDVLHEAKKRNEISAQLLEKHRRAIYKLEAAAGAKKEVEGEVGGKPDSDACLYLPLPPDVIRVLSDAAGGRHSPPD